MRYIITLLILVTALFGGQNIPIEQKPKAMLESISHNAINIGTGKMSDVYVFLDPLCSSSRTLMKQIDANKLLQLSNTYHIFLYRLPRLDSEKTMQYIYQSDDPQKSLIEIMVDGDEVDLADFKANEKTLKMLVEVSEVAKKLDMKLRPYMISFDKDSKFCRVSEGTASCLEEF